MMSTKYIVFEDATGLETMVVFGETLTHRDMARCLHAQVTSAGFLMIKRAPSGNGEYSEYPRVICYGRSESLHMDSRPEEDAVIARKTLDLRQD